MNNPCKECIVTSMCEEGCDKFIDYLKNHMTPYNPASFNEFANQVRKGIVVLREDDTKWKFK